MAASYSLPKLAKLTSATSKRVTLSSYRRPPGSFVLFYSFVLGLALLPAFAPFSWYWLAVLIPAPAFVIWSKLSPAKAALSGYFFGLAYMGGSAYWVYNSLHDYGQASSFVAALTTILFVAILAVHFALLSVLVSLTRQNKPRVLFSLLLWPSLWTLSEWARTASFTDFPWNLLGQAMIDSPFTGLFPVVGVYGVSWLSVFLAAFLVFLCSNFFFIPRGKLSLSWLRLCSLAFVAVILATAFLAEKARWTMPLSTSVRAAVAQANINQKDKFNPQYFVPIVKRYVDLTSKADADIVVWPETALPKLYNSLLDIVFLPLAKALAARGSALVSGVFVRDPESGRIHNSLVVFAEEPVLYHKRHLVPFGEYIPFRAVVDVFSDLIIVPMSDIAPGESLGLLTIGKHMVAVSICYEVAFSGEMRAAAAQANYLLNISNDSWFGDSNAPHQHLQIARLRAAEAQLPMVRATSTGISAIIAANGSIIAQSALFAEQLLSAEFQPREGTSPYLRWGNWPLLSASSVMALIGLFSFLRRKFFILGGEKKRL